MQSNCEHVALFSEPRKQSYSGGAGTYSWSIEATCPKCGAGLSNEKIKDALQKMYAGNIAAFLFELYECRQRLCEISNELSRNGISHRLMPSKPNDEAYG